jgi:hypothetical protein
MARWEWAALWKENEMTNRDNLTLILIMLLICLFLGCVEEGGGGTCHKLIVDCPGVVNDYIVTNDASDLKQKIVGDLRHFSYYHCASGKRSGTLKISKKCAVSFRY